MTYFYTISYDEIKDDFYGIVDGTVNGESVVIFEITDTQEMVDYLKTGVMKHIDDVKGLEDFLKVQDKIKNRDRIVMIETTTY